MYICICNAIRECELRRVGRRTEGDAESIYAMLGKRPQCRQCLEEADHILEEERARASGPILVAA
jgi:bacterioferritin-associated ferredoxin